MKFLTLLAVIFFLLPEVYLSAQNADDILGTWMTGEGKGKVKIEKINNKYFGKIVWLREPNGPDGLPKKDKNNPDPSKRSASLMGYTVLKNFVFDGEEWEDGTIYDPNNGKDYSCVMTLVDKNTLHVRGYIGISLIGRTQTWKRTN
jgi:uncharacterized protein (DUF2147 family)